MMMESNENNMPQNQENNIPAQESRPNETGGIHFEGHIKIWDPESAEVYIDKRA
jgi:hypothetical protein